MGCPAISSGSTAASRASSPTSKLGRRGTAASDPGARRCVHPEPRAGCGGACGLRLGRLRERYPRLITVDISGYGDTGEYATMKAYDLLVQAESGLAMITGHPAGPGRVGVSACDIACGMAAHAGVLEALIGRGITGRGKGLKVSLFDGMADWMNVPLLFFEGTGKAPERLGLAHPSICPYGAFATADGALVLISIQNEREWAEFCAAFLDEPDLPQRDGFQTNVDPRRQPRHGGCSRRRCVRPPVADPGRREIACCQHGVRLRERCRGASRTTRRCDVRRSRRRMARFPSPRRRFFSRRGAPARRRFRRSASTRRRSARSFASKACQPPRRSGGWKARPIGTALYESRPRPGGAAPPTVGSMIMCGACASPGDCTASRA